MQRNLDICAKCEHHEELPETLRGMCIVPGGYQNCPYQELDEVA